ncbi:MAG: hypothetical protein HUJ56_05980 [Erysipelotrichaceae bacterium]|nr:hypothetical protein [Erysipelotrichaceae bacterium]
MSPVEKQAMKGMMETNGLMMPQQDEVAEAAIRNQRINRLNNQIEEFTNRFDEHIEHMEEFAEKLSTDMNGLEIMPVYGYVLIEPFKNNPFQKLKRTDSGLILADGFAPIYKSEEDGQFHEEKSLVGVGTVVETGHTCEFIKPGDIVMYPHVSEVQVPFYNFGFIMVNEQRIICVVNEKLTQRKEELKHGAE